MLGELSSSLERNRVARLASTDRAEALRIARAIGDPWFRCQALAYVAHHCPEMEERLRLIEESFQAGAAAPDPNRIVTVSAWPLKVLCKTGLDLMLESETDRLLNVIATEPSPVRRAHALDAMLGALLGAPGYLFWRAFDMFQLACLMPLTNGKRNTRGESRLTRWVVFVERVEAGRGRALIEAIKGPTLRAQALRILAQHHCTDLDQLYGWPHLP